MAKKIVNTETNENEVVVAKAAPEQVKLTNMMQTDWIAPICLVGGKITTAQRNLVRPLASIVVDKANFLAYAKTKVFQAMLDLKLITVSKVNAAVKATKHDLTSAPIVEPPAELKGEGNQRNLDILNSPVTLEINPVK